MRYQLTPVRTAINKNSTKKTNAGKDVEKKESSYTVDRNLNWCSHCRSFLKNLKSELPLDSVIPEIINVLLIHDLKILRETKS